jgi:uncharacterized membrane protein YedE/YeeE
MADFLLTRPPPEVIGLLLGLTVVGVLATLNQQLGALGGYSAVYERVTRRTPALGWKAWFLGGILLGSLAFRLLAGENTVGDGYGWLTREFADWAVGPLLVLGGVMIGYGAKRAGGCTAANGICGTALGSPASFVATGTFLGVAIGVTFLIDAVIA